MKLCAICQPGNKVHTKDTNTHTDTRTHIHRGRPMFNPSRAHSLLYRMCSSASCLASPGDAATTGNTLALALAWFGCHRLSPYLNYWLAPKPAEATPSGANYSTQIRGRKKKQRRVEESCIKHQSDKHAHSSSGSSSWAWQGVVPGIEWGLRGTQGLNTYTHTHTYTDEEVAGSQNQREAFKN